MLSRLMIRKLSHDTALMKMDEYIITYDIPPLEKLKRSIALTDFWIENRRKYYRLQKQLRKISKLLTKNIVDSGYLLLQFKAICDGKKVTDETVFAYSIEDLKEILKVVSGIEENCFTNKI